jgi:hypothetical protein
MKQSIIKSGRPVLVKNMVGIPILLQAPAAIAAAIDDVSGGIKLTATAVSGADSYTYYASIDGGAYTEIASGQGTDYTYAPIEAGSYSFGVTAVRGSSESAMTATSFTDWDIDGYEFFLTADGDLIFTADGEPLFAKEAV